ncbi:DUF4421 family protein [Wenyingzhuangia sp. IMCC45467]
MNNFLTLIFLLTYINLFCQKVKDTTYIKDLNKKISLKLTTSNKSESFSVKSPQQKYELAPNTEYITKLGFNYRFISFSLKLPTEFITDSYYNDRKGATKIFSFDINFFTEHWHHYLSINKTKGYYITNTEDFINNWDPKTDDYIQFPELVYTAFSGISSYVLNPNFSLKFITNQNEKQLKSAGSFIPTITYKYYSIDNKEALTTTNSTQKSKILEIVPEIGYYYTHVLNQNFYFSGGITSGAGYKNTQLLTRYMSNSIRSKNHNIILQAGAELTIGYDDEYFFSGLKLANTWNQEIMKNSNTTNLHNEVFFRFFIGYRFNAPKKIDTFITDKILSKIPF